MEEFLRQLDARVKGSYSEVHESTAPDLKPLSQSVYEQMAECFSAPGTFESAMKCADASRAPLKQLNQATSDRMKDIGTRFKKCLASCGVTQQTFPSDELKRCANDCGDETVSAIQGVQPELQALTRRLRP